MKYSRLTFWACILFVLVIAACSGSDDEKDNNNTDGDVEVADLESESDTDSSSTTPSTKFDAKMIGDWELVDTNALDWFQANSIKKLYLNIGGGNFNFWMEKEAGNVCGAYNVKLNSDNRFVLRDDPSNCWYEVKFSASGQLELYSRHAEDPTAIPWSFVFNKINSIPGFDGGTCKTASKCVNYRVNN